jgi:ABC-type phosphate transport system permease subunit
MSFAERWEFMAGQSLEELMAMPSPKVAYGVLGLQFFVLFLGTGTALYFARDAVR